MSDSEPEMVAKRPRTVVIIDVTPFWLDVTFTKQVTQKNKKFIDGRILMDPKTLTAKLFDLEGGFVCAGNFQAVLGFTERWNRAVDEGTDFTVTKGFFGHLVFIPLVRRVLPGRHIYLEIS